MNKADSPNPDETPQHDSAQKEAALDAFDEQARAIEQLTAELELLNGHRFIKVHNSLWRLLLLQMMRGLAFGLGSVLGATILVSLVGWWASQFSFLPVIGEWLNQLVEMVQAAQ